MTQGTLIRKLCTYTKPNPTRRAIFEFDKLVRSIYTLRYLRDPQLERNVHRSQNRIESYHQLRSTIAQVGGKKELTGRTDIEIEISNQCGRLIANAIIYYNSAILSRLLTKYEASRQHQGRGADHADLAGGLAAHPAEWALHVPQRRQDDRPGCASWPGWIWSDGIFGGSGLHPRVKTSRSTRIMLATWECQSVSPSRRRDRNGDGAAFVSVAPLSRPRPARPAPWSHRSPGSAVQRGLVVR